MLPRPARGACLLVVDIGVLVKLWPKMQPARGINVRRIIAMVRPPRPNRNALANSPETVCKTIRLCRRIAAI